MLKRKLEIFSELDYYINKEKRLKLEIQTESLIKELSRVSVIIEELIQEYKQIQPSGPWLKSSYGRCN